MSCQGTARHLGPTTETPSEISRSVVRLTDSSRRPDRTRARVARAREAQLNSNENEEELHGREGGTDGRTNERTEAEGLCQISRGREARFRGAVPWLTARFRDKQPTSLTTSTRPKISSEWRDSFFCRALHIHICPGATVDIEVVTIKTNSCVFTYGLKRC